MLSGKLTGRLSRWLSVFVIGLTLAVGLSMVSAKDADAAPINSVERFLAAKRLWFEHDWDGDYVCHMYDFKIGDAVRHLRVAHYAYPRNPIINQCRFSTPLTPRAGGVGSVSNNVLRIVYPSGPPELISLGGYYRAYDALRISRSKTGGSWWVGCRSPDHPLHGYC